MMMTFACQNPKAINSLDFSPLLNQDLLTDWCCSNSRLELPMRYRSIMVDIRSPTQWVNCCHINNTVHPLIASSVLFIIMRHTYKIITCIKICNAALVIKMHSPLRVNPYKSENPLLCLRTISITFIHCTSARYTQLARIIHKWIRAQWRWKEIPALLRKHKTAPKERETWQSLIALQPCRASIPQKKTNKTCLNQHCSLKSYTTS